MRKLLSQLMTAACLLAASILPMDAQASAAPVTFKTDDGITIHGNYYQAPKPKALILLFHQAGSSKDEYAAIAPRLVEAGYSALAIDQRSGGSLFGPNETAAEFKHPVTYLDAKRDLEAGLTWAGHEHLPVILWGSSYSSSLVFLVAAEHPQAVKAVLAFSPGEYFNKPALVEGAAARVKVPIYVTSANTPDEIEAARKIIAASPAGIKEQYIPTSGGVHGSSTLLAARNQPGMAANWTAVLAFLARVMS